MLEKIEREMKKKQPRLSLPDDTVKVVRSMRYEPPSDYMKKIEPFSLLQKRGDDKYVSSEFEAGGYKWSLILFPNGDKTNDASGYISLYLALQDAESLTPGSEVNAMLRFFVLDQISDKYMTFEDGRVVSFNALEKERGISKLLSLNTLTDPKNGFLVDDCFTFGAELIFTEYGKEHEKYLSLIKETNDATFSWTIESFFALHGGMKDSKEFAIGGFTWFLILFARECDFEQGGFLEIVLCPLEPGGVVSVDFTITLKDQVHGKHITKTTNESFSSSTCYRGFKRFIALADLKDKKRGFIVNDTIIVEAQISCRPIM